MKRLLKIIDSISDWSGKLFAYLLWPGVAVLVYEVVARYVFNAPTIWAHGMTQRIFAVYYFICGAYISLTRSHINMDIIYNRFTPRKKAVLDIISFFFFFAFCGVLLWYGSQYGLKSALRLEPCNTPFRAPLYPIKLMIPIGALLIILQELAQLWRNIYIAIKGKSYEH
ncbi:MAG: TRAP transporter small permease subunit [Desulfobacterales bacterium]|jgi:TRAP-type mannitol/chloroaromatic compound transport system permease small subunit